jgi:small redox-active disulfide protein 2
MTKVQVLGSGCSKCQITARQVQEVAQQLGRQIELEKVEQPAAIVAMGVLATPAVAIDGKVVHSGSVPSREKIESWLRTAA